MSVDTKKYAQSQWGSWVWIKWKAGAPENAWSRWKEIDKIKEAWSTTGEWDCVLWINLDRPEDVEKLVWKEVRNNQWVEKTDTHWAKKYW